MAYISTNPPIRDISILSVQGSVNRMWHNASFLMMLNGEVQVRVGGHATYLNDNGIMLVEPDVAFEVTGHGSNLLMIIRVDYDFFIQGKTDRVGTLVCNSAEDDTRDYSLLRQMLSHMALTYYENSECKELRQLELCYALLYYINTSHYESGISAGAGKADGESRGLSIISYIESNYMQDIRLDDLSEATFLSPSYLSRLFKKLTGSNFKTYLEEVRLRHAVEEMRSSDQTITSIAYNNGFPNVSALSGAIRKKYDMSPNEFRRTLKEKKTEVLEVPAFHEIEYDTVRRDLENLAGPEPLKALGMYRFPDQIEYTVEDVSDVHAIKPIWKEMINLGTLAGLSNVNMKDHLVMLQQEIGFRYARIEGVLTEDSMPVLPNGQYNFSQFDRAIELLLSLKMIPFLDLSFKGDYVLLNRSEVLYRGDRPRTPSSEKAFQEKVSALIRHCINTFGAGEVERWGVEICALHDETLSFIETPEEFAHRFCHVYRMIKAWLPNMSVGGPEHNIAVDYAFLQEVLSLLKNEEVIPDFLSLCAVPYEPTQGSDKGIPFVLSSRADYIRDRVFDVKELLKNSPGHESLPIWITAFSQDIRTRNHVNDSAYQATFIVKNTLDLIGMVDLIGYWQLSDVDSEYIDTTRILFGGTGIISKDGLRKPGFSALKRLGNLNTLMIRKEGNMLLTTNAINTYNIVLYNYAHFTDLYCLTTGEGVTHDNVYTVFADAATRDIAIHLNGLENGRYKVITTTLNRDYGSLFDDWLRYGIMDELQPHDIRYLSDIVHPQRAVRYHECSDGSLHLSMQMLPHEVKFLLILREL